MTSQMLLTDVAFEVLAWNYLSGGNVNLSQEYIEPVGRESFMQSGCFIGLFSPPLCPYLTLDAGLSTCHTYHTTGIDFLLLEGEDS